MAISSALRSTTEHATFLTLFGGRAYTIGSDFLHPSPRLCAAAYRPPGAHCAAAHAVTPRHCRPVGCELPLPRRCLCNPKPALLLTHCSGHEPCWHEHFDEPARF